MTNRGGSDNAGSIFRMEPDGTGLAVQHSFTIQNQGARPYISVQLIQLPTGKMYGVTQYGGNNNQGVLFEYDPATNVYVKKIDFEQSTGREPMGRLTLAGNGKLYGLATSGGANNAGTIFEYDVSTNVYTKKIDFASATGSSPYGNSLYLHTNGKFYGMTVFGGANNFGVLFEYDPATNIYTKKLDFAGASNGANPYSSLMMTSAGKVFGLTTNGGANNQGTLFEYAPATNTLTKKIDFNATNGSYPYSDLAEGSNNLLYGVTPVNGTIFEYNPTNNAFTKKIDLNAINAPFSYSTLVKGNNGKFYGMTTSGGATGEGLLFEYDAATNTYTKKIDFTNPTGIAPYGSLSLASNGNLYGLMYQGGISGSGVLFEYNAGTNTYTKKIDLSISPLGSYPLGGLMRASNNKLYGMTQIGGENDKGVIFEMDPVTNSFTKKHDFIEATGTFPQGDLTQAANGKLYGLTPRGGATDDGTIFEFDPTTGVYTKKHDFDDTNGSEPFAKLVLASNNKLYGTTYSGGAEGYGVIFEYDPATNLFTKKADFDYTTTGFVSYDRLIQATNGKFYGLNRDGGASGNLYGAIFEYDLATNTITAKVNLGGANGETPEGGLIQAPNGKLYGVTRFGGANSQGVLFEYDIASNTYTKKFDFGGSASAGVEPKGSLALSPNGKLYGATTYGGTNGKGIIFEYDFVTDILTKKHDFNGTDGAGSLYSRLLFVKGQQTISFGSLAEKTIGDPAFTLSATSSVGLPISFTSTNPSVATISGKQVTLVGAGSTTIIASQVGDASYNAASVSRTLVVNKNDQVISFDALTPIDFGAPGFSLVGTATSGLPVTYTSSNAAVATISGTTVTIVGAGTTSITASQSGDANHNAAASVSQTLVVNKIDQTISFNALTSKTLGDAAFNLAGIATSGLAVVYASSNPSVATITGSTVAIVGVGTTIITASQPGDGNFNAAIAVSQPLVVNKMNQTITFDTLPIKTFGDPTFGLAATATSGLMVTYASSNTSVATLTGSTVTIVGAGTTTLTASQLGDANYNAASEVTQVLTILKKDQSISFSPVPDKTLGEASFEVTATASSSLPLTLTSSSNKITINGLQITMVNPGRAILLAAQEGDNNYNQAVAVERSFCIKPANPTVTLSSDNTATPLLTSSASTGNQWYRNGTALSGATSTTLTVTQAGIYKLQVQVDDCMSGYSDEQIIVITGDPTIESIQEISLYPNPVKEWLTVKLMDDQQLKEIKILDANGKKMDEQQSFGQEIHLDVSGYRQGHYFIMVRDGDRLQVQRFVKD